MATIKHGTITLAIEDHLAPPEKAGKLSPQEIARIPRARRGIGLACAQAADAMEKAGAKFTPPAGVTADGLRAAGKRAEDIDQYLLDLDVVRQILQQSNLLFDAEAWEQIRKMNDQVKVQAKHDPALALMFDQVLRFFALGPRPTRDPSEGDPTS
jgi:hypothetical protein